MSGIRLEQVRFSYGAERPVLRGVSLDVQAGEIVGLLGRNGAGKTTTFRILAGLLRPDEGAVWIDGIATQEEPVTVRRRTAFLPDTPLLYDQMSAEENMNMFALLWGLEAKAAQARSEQLLREVNLWNARHEWVRSYSTGMKQKLAICTALLHEPSAIIMDEPFGGLDVDSSLWGRDTMRAQARDGKAILFSSHVPELIEAIADSVAVLDQGVIVDKASIDEVKRAGGAIRYFGLKAPRVVA